MNAFTILLLFILILLIYFYLHYKENIIDLQDFKKINKNVEKV